MTITKPWIQNLRFYGLDCRRQWQNTILLPKKAFNALYFQNPEKTNLSIMEKSHSPPFFYRVNKNLYTPWFETLGTLSNITFGITWLKKKKKKGQAWSACLLSPLSSRIDVLILSCIQVILTALVTEVEVFFSIFPMRILDGKQDSWGLFKTWNILLRIVHSL